MPTNILIRELQGGNVLTLPYVPESFDLQNQSNQATINVVGRNNNILQAVSGQRTLSFACDFPAENTKQNRYMENALTATRFLESLTKIDSVRGQPKVELSWGNMFDLSKWVVVRTSRKAIHFKNWMNYSPKQVYLTVELVEQPDEAVDRDFYNQPYENLYLRTVDAIQQVQFNQLF